jgi:hypothetical protein
VRGGHWLSLAAKNNSAPMAIVGHKARLVVFPRE